MSALTARTIIRNAIAAKELSYSDYRQYQTEKLLGWNGKEPVKKLDQIDIILATRLSNLKASVR